MSMKFVYAGGPCTCRPDRYVRYFVPRVPGLQATIFCRANDAPKEGLAQHPVPPDAMLVMHAPSLRSGRD
jgi:hypothetical protein